MNAQLSPDLQKLHPTRPQCQSPAVSGATPAGSGDPGPFVPCSGPGSHFVLSRTATRGTRTMRFRRLVARHEDAVFVLILFTGAYVALVLLGAAIRANLFGGWL